MAKKLSAAEKYRQLKAQTESAGMTVEEVNGRIVVKGEARGSSKKSSKVKNA